MCAKFWFVAALSFSVPFSADTGQKLLRSTAFLKTINYSLKICLTKNEDFLMISLKMFCLLSLANSFVIYAYAGLPVRRPRFPTRKSNGTFLCLSTSLWNQSPKLREMPRNRKKAETTINYQFHFHFFCFQRFCLISAATKIKLNFICDGQSLI